MILKEIDEQLNRWFCTYDRKGGISIGTWNTIEGDPINFLFCQEDDKYSCITTNEHFSEWMAWITDGWKEKAPLIEKYAALYGVQWDNEKGRLFIRFRRNEMTLAQGIMRLQQAVFLIASLEF